MARPQTDLTAPSCRRCPRTTEDGQKNTDGRILHPQLGVDGGMVGGGVYQPKAAALKPVRQRIVDHPDQFDQVLATLGAAQAHLDRSSAVETMPRGFAEAADHRHVDSIRLTRLLAIRPLPKSVWLDDSAIDRAAEAAEAMVALYEFIEGSG